MEAELVSTARFALREGHTARSVSAEPREVRVALFRERAVAFLGLLAVRERFQAGERDTVFPAGSYWWPKYGGVWYAADPPGC